MHPKPGFSTQISTEVPKVWEDTPPKPCGVPYPITSKELAPPPAATKMHAQTYLALGQGWEIRAKKNCAPPQTEMVPYA